MIVALEEAKRRLVALDNVLKELGNQLRIDECAERASELERETVVQDFWNDAERSTRILREIKQLKDTVESYRSLCARLEDAYALCEMAIEANDEDSVEEVVSETDFIEKEAEKKRIEVLLSGPYDRNNAILSFHPGAGGTEAQDWASMLYRMYVRWGEAHGYNVKLVDWLDGDEAGLKSATIMVEGINAYGYLKGENGVHRLVRVSPFDSSGRRHTSFASVEVMPEFEDDDTIVISEADLEITAHRSSGAGGQ
ncbi:MAG: PCRF domain-containing protein, partial [Clostridia bacterium]|nr:PCRF domain-containing protein [Clostridia bacterium]